MTYYSDLLIVISELEALESGQPPARSSSELRLLCRRMLEIDPNEFLVKQLLEMLEALPKHVRKDALGSVLVDKVRAMFRKLEEANR